MTRLSTIYSRAGTGLDAPLVRVETHISRGLPKLSIVGLPETAVKESKDRVRSAILNSKFEFPTRRITINLSPADLPKDGGRFDLPIAVGILIASAQLTVENIHEYEFAGELALTGELRSINGSLPIAIATRKAKRSLIIPTNNAFEASMPQDNIVYPANSLLDVCMHLTGEQRIQSYSFIPPHQKQQQNEIDMSDIHGQPLARRALEIAAAGRHSLLMVGPPGTGKTMLARCLPTIMPKLTTDEALEVAAIYSIGKHNLQPENWRKRPFRSPHHTASSIAMVGGGSTPSPGEISLAHNGVLFLDELPEYDRKVLEVLREPMEDGSIIISRAARKTKFPAQFQLIAAMNPCPCGQLGNPSKQCRCSIDQIIRYQTKISGPLLDRIDMYIDIPIITAELLTTDPKQKNECSAIIQSRVQKAMHIQQQRNIKSNSMLGNNEITAITKLSVKNKQVIKQAIENLNLSARGYYKVLKLARTIADLAGSTDIETYHLTEALSFRPRLRCNI